MLLQSKMERTTTPLPFPSPSPSPNPNPNPNPDPSLNRTTPFRPPARPTDHHRESDSTKIPHDNALFQHVCIAANHGELTLIESFIILFAQHLCFVHTTHTPCCHHCTAMLGSAVSINKWTILCFNKTRVFRAINEQYRHHVAAI